MSNILLKIENLKKSYKIKGNIFNKSKSLKVLRGISFYLKERETLGIVGESGCGKSTTAKLILKIENKTSGNILYNNKDIFTMNKKELKEYRKNIQLIFQNPHSSLNPRWRVGKIISEPLELNTNLTKREIKKKVYYVMERVALSKESYYKYPHQFSGGQKQRIAVSRALCLNPKIIVCDEPVSALDVSTQAQILNLLNELQESFNLSYIFISHDLGVVDYISDRVAVIYLGKIVEIAKTKDLFDNPKHPYTKALLKSVPQISLDGKKSSVKPLKGEAPSIMNPPSGCGFRTRCNFAREECSSINDEMLEISDNHFCACPFANDNL